MWQALWSIDNNDAKVSLYPAEATTTAVEKKQVSARLEKFKKDIEAALETSRANKDAKK